MSIDSELLERIARWCAYQDRSRLEVQRKLWEWKAGGEEISPILSRLESEGFIDEHRFAHNYARGKFRTKGWGRIKIRSGLREKGITDALARKAIESEIDDDEYQKTLAGQAEKKWHKLKDKPPVKRKAALLRYLAQRGFESYLIYDWLRQLNGDK